MARKLIVEVVLDSAAYSRQVKKAQATTAAFSRDLETVGRGSATATLGVKGLGRSVAAASAFFLGFSKLSEFAKAGYEEMITTQKVAARTAAVLRSTGGVAGVTAENVDTLGASLQDLSGVSANTIKTAENLLLTFTNIRGEAFEPATKAALDMSVALGEDLSSSAAKVGKALNNPIGGIKTLRRAGVSFTREQERMIRTLVESGQTLDAQRIILGRLDVAYGGAAKAAGGTLGGQLDILKNHALDLASSIAKKLNPELDDLAKKANKAFEAPPGKDEKSDVAKIGDVAAAAFHKAGDASDTLHQKLGQLGAPLWSAAAPPRKMIESLIHLYDALHPVHVELGHVSTDLERLTAGMGKAASKATGKVDLRTAGGIVIPPGTTPADVHIATAQQRNTWFDAVIGRQLSRVSAAPIEQQIGMLQRIAAAIKKRIAVTNDITRQLNLEDQLFAIAQQQKQVREQLQHDFFDRLQFNVDKADLTKTSSDNLAALATYQRAVEKAVQTEGHTLALDQTLLGIQQAHAGILAEQAAAAQAARQAAQERKLGWLEFALERAQETKTLKDDLPALRAIESYWKTRIRQEGRTLESVRELWRTRKAIRDLNKQDVDPLAGLFQVSSRGLANILAAGTGLGAAGRRQLGFNIAGAEIQPVHVHLNMDGREVASVVTKQQARSGKRTASQTSGRRG